MVLVRMPQPVKNPQPGSAGEELFWLHCRAYQLEPLREFIFHHSRKWRFDFAFPHKLIAVEIEGLTNPGGRHQRRSGFEGDCYKYNAAAVLGWRVLRYTPSMVQSGQAIDEVRAILVDNKR